ncbi:MAG: amino acid adenylation domain-containing protein, partial [Pseudomonadota bacterium]|nr:amino acid adenylation domain-containing protein [Pseudomonadota bacterium]
MNNSTSSDNPQNHQINNLCHRLCQICRNLLQQDDIEPEDDFFSRGGNSILAIKFTMEIEKEFGVRIKVKSFFDNPTILELAELLQDTGRLQPESVTKKREDKEGLKDEKLGDQPLVGRRLPISRFQKKFWYKWKIWPENVEDNYCYTYEVTGKLNLKLLVQAFLHLVKSHETFSSIYAENENGQVYLFPDTGIEPETEIINGENFSEDKLQNFISNFNRRPFELNKKPAIRLNLVKISDQRYVAVLGLHHITIDGTYGAEIPKQWALTYNALLQLKPPVLPPAPSFAEYIKEEPSLFTAENEDKSSDFMMDLAKGVSPYLKLPYCDTGKPATRKAVYIELDREIVDQVKKLARSYNSTLFFYYSSIFAALLLGYSSQKACLLHYQINRRPAKFKGLFNPFVDSMPLRAEMQTHTTTKDIILAVSEQRSASKKYTGSLFEDFLTRLRSERCEKFDANLFNIGVNQAALLTNTPLPLDGVNTRQLTPPESEMSNDLILEIEIVDAAQCRLSYNGKRFSPEFAEKIADEFKKLVELTVKHPESALIELLQFRDQRKPGIGSQKPENIIPAKPDHKEQKSAAPKLSPSHMQKRLWFLHKMEGDQAHAYNSPLFWEITGEPNIKALKFALDKLLERHESLRTIFPDNRGEPLLVVLPPQPLSLRIEEIAENGIEIFMEGETKRAFDLEQGPLFIPRLLKIEGEKARYFLSLNFHHIITDAWSLDIITRELVEFYTAKVENRPARLPELTIQYSEFSRRQNRIIESQEMGRKVAECASCLEGSCNELTLFPDKPGSDIQTFAGAAGAFFIEPELTQELDILRKSTGITPFIVFLAAFGTLLRHYTGEQDILIGVPAAGREELDLQHLTGFFVNTIPVRLKMAGDPSFREFLKDVRAAMAEALDYQDVPIDRLIRELKLERSSNRSPLIQVMFSLQERLRESLELPGLTMNLVLPPRHISIFNLTMELIPLTTGMLGLLEYNTDLFNSETISRITAHYVNLLQRIVKNPDARLSALPEMTQEEHRLVCGKNMSGESLDEVKQRIVQEIFLKQAENPHKPALILDDFSLTRAELENRARQLAAYFRERGLKKGDHVAIALPRTIDMVPVLLALMKIGAVLVPLDPLTPKPRCHHILSTAKLKLLITEGTGYAISAACREDGISIVEIEKEAKNIAQSSLSAEAVMVAADDPLYIIYTSGTTGKPKGVLVSNRGFEKHCQACIKTYGITHEDRILQFAPIFFDAGLEQIFPALIAGATLVMRGETPWAATEFHQKVAEFGLTVLDLPPLYIKELLNYWNRHPESTPRGLRQVLTGGEALPVEVAKQWLASPVGDVPLLNVYGPTEAIVTATLFRVHSNNVNACATAAVPIGRPLPGRILRILDENGKAVPPGVPGELCIGGECLAEGYYGEPELTAQAFSFWGEENPLKLYRTGDRVRLTDYGVIEFLGRLDRQIKLRGFRIDPGEIESGLCEQTEVLDACVVLQKDKASGEAFLAAYIVAPEAENRSGQTELDEIRIRLKERLPGYMIPQRFAFIPKIPVTAAGKIDEKKLPKISITTTTKILSEQQEPLSEIEKAAAAIWQKLLKCDHVGRHDNFFDLGGHSLLLLRLHALLGDELGSELEVVDLFRYPTVAAQARAISGKSTISEKISPVPAKSEVKDITSNEIAVIGMAGRFPGADNIDLFWKNLEAETESITFFSRKELLGAGFSEAEIDQPGFIAAHGILQDIETFDAKLFEFSPREASVMDPQHRIFLETAWHTLEHGGYDPFRYPGKIGVFAGCSMNSYLINNLAANKMFTNAMDGYQLSMGNDKDFLPTKTSYKLNLRGPSINVNTACSTSLVAIHTACKALLAGECEMALAGGVSINTPQISGHLHQQNGIASADGHCRAFSAEAAGTVGGSGVGIILLKPLADAVRDRDTIHAIIKGSALNNDGSNKVGFTAPGLEGQREVILDALAAAGVSATSISYVEAHGTGTALGDPVEIKALSEAFRKETDKCGFCAIGSVKSNIGHLDAAAGMAGIIKTIEALKNRKIPATLHCETPSRQINFAKTPFYPATRSKDWDFGSRPRRAGLSSFGMGGTNSHIIIEEAPEPTPTTTAKGPWIFPLSARSQTALAELGELLAQHFAENPDLNPADISYTLAKGRALHKYRSAIICHTLSEAVTLLGQTDPQKPNFDDGLNPQLKRCRESWLAGEEVDWQTLFINQKRARLPLPLYPFQRQRYWIEAPPQNFNGVKVNHAPEEASKLDGGLFYSDPIKRKSDISRWFSVPSWKRTPIPNSSGKPLLPLIILHTGSPLELELVKKLENHLIEPIVYEYASLHNNHAAEALDPLSAAGLTAIFNASKNLSKNEPLTVLNLALLPSLASTEPRLRLQHVKKMALAAPITLAQALSQCDHIEKAKILFIGSELYQIDENDLPVPEKQLISGPAQVIPQEYQNLECKIIDLKINREGKLSEKSLELLPLELKSNGRCPRVVLRNWRWEEDFSNLKLDLKTPANGLKNRLRDNGVYLISGGLGGIGITLAGFIATHSRNPKIALLSRTPFPERNRWQNIIENNREELQPQELQQAEIINKIYQWEQLGATIILLTADAAESQQIKAVVDELCGQFGKIDGVIHAAGVAGGKLLLQTDAQELDRVLRPKVDAILHLAQVIDLGELDFAVFCSSLNSVLGGTGQLAYTAANAFLDALAMSYRGRGQVVSIAWDTWKEVGMAARAATVRKKTIRSYPMNEIVKTRSLSPAINWTLGEHQIDDNYVLPGTAYLDITYTSLKEADFNSDFNSIRLEDFTILAPLAIAQERGGSAANLRIGISDSSAADTSAFAIHSANREKRGDWIEHARAKVHSPATPPEKIDLKDIKKRCTKIIPEQTINLEDGIKVKAGRRWDFPVTAYFGDQEALAFMELPADLHYDFKQHPLHPALLDRATAFMLADIENAWDFMPFQFGIVNIYAPLTPGIISYSRRLKEENSSGRLLFDITIMSSEGDILLEIKRYTMLKVAEAGKRAAVPSIKTNKPVNLAPKTEDQAISPILRSIIANGISPAEGADIFAGSLSSRGEPVIYVCTTDLATERESARSHDQSLEISALIASHSIPRASNKQPRPHLTTPFREPQGRVAIFMAKIWSDLLGIDGIGADDDLFELGADSLVAIQAIARFGNEFGTQLSIDRFFAAPTIAGLAAFIALPEDNNNLAEPVPGKPVTGGGKGSRKGEQKLSYAQQRLWFLSQQLGPNHVYNLPVALKLQGELDIEALKEALKALAERHDALSTSIRERDFGPVMRIHKNLEIPFRIEDISNFPENDRLRELNLRFKEEAGTPFELNLAPLFRSLLIVLGNNEYGLIITCHHIIADGWSIGIIIEDLNQLYNAKTENIPLSLPPLSAGHSDFVNWQNRSIATNLNEATIKFWRKKFQGIPAISSMPTDKPRPSMQSFAGDSLSFKISPSLTSQLKLRAKTLKTTLNVLLTTAFGLLLSRYSGQNSITIGTALANRSRPEFEPVVGLLANVMPLRLDLSDRQSFAEHVKRTAKAGTELLQHAQIPFEKLVKELNISQDMSHQSVFQTYFTLLPPLDDPPQTHKLKQEWVEFKSDIAKFDLSLYMEERDGGLTSVLEFATALFERESVKSWIRSFLRLLEIVAERADRAITESDLISTRDQARLTKWGSGKSVNFAEFPLIEQFNRQVIDQPEAIAIIGSQQSLTYAELDVLSEKIKKTLQSPKKDNIIKDDFIGICMEKSPAAIAAMLAVLKNGSAFIPLDPGQPEKRLKFMIRDARLKKILVAKETLDLVKNFSQDELTQTNSIGEIKIIDVSTLPAAPISERRVAGPQSAPKYALENPAYVIYTSGSTGRPKGVVIPHRGLLNTMYWLSNTFSISANDTISQFSSLSFDASIMEIWPTLCSGACLHLVPNDLMFDPLELRDWIIAKNITVHFCSTAMSEILLQLEWPRSCRLRILYTGGDSLRVRPTDGLPFITHNMYGPTENSVASTSAVISTTGNLNPEIGKPLDNVNCHLLRQNKDLLTPVPPGAPGELYLSGSGLAAGYLNDPERTATSFLHWSPTTFRTDKELPDTIRIYKTGDLVRYRHDGNLEFLGRLDNQVKIRGFRIELGEIENALKLHADILDATVITHGNAADNKRLVAFVVNKGKKPTLKGELTAHLKTILPTYMLPTDIAAVKKFPLLPSGKIDRQALADSFLKHARSEKKEGTVYPKRTNKIAFMFSGQGSQPVITRELLKEPVFKKNIEYCTEILKPYLQLDIRDILASDSKTSESNPGKFSEQTSEPLSTRIAQPALFVFEYALAQLMIEQEITPTIMIGHSIGEWVAAAISKVFS